ncbi:MAG TPA: hypothetical protein VN922_11025 [Bacteroidia bacterium]|nr:hypothetical protein [Bacteroidia bacterium]
MRKVCILFLLSAFSPLFSFGQLNEITPDTKDVTTSDVFYKYSIQAGTDITYAMGNNAFKMDFGNGVYALNAAINESITKRLYAGVEVYDNEFGQSLPLYGILAPRMFFYMGGARIGYRSSLTNDFLFNAAFTMGEAMIKYTDAPVEPKNVKSGFASLRIIESYRVNEQFWIGLHVSFTYLPYTYSPFDIGIGQYYPYVPSDYKGATTYLGWGFSIYYLFSKSNH